MQSCKKILLLFLSVPVVFCCKKTNSQKPVIYNMAGTHTLVGIEEKGHMPYHSDIVWDTSFNITFSTTINVLDNMTISFYDSVFDVIDTMHFARMDTTQNEIVFNSITPRNYMFYVIILNYLKNSIYIEQIYQYDGFVHKTVHTP